jgi:hypothetical protein
MLHCRNLTYKVLSALWRLFEKYHAVGWRGYRTMLAEFVVSLQEA